MTEAGTEQQKLKEGNARTAAAGLEPIADHKAQKRYLATVGTHPGESHEHKDLLQTAARANERTPMPDESHPFLSDRKDAFNDLKSLQPLLQDGTLTPRAFGDRINKIFTDRGLPPVSVDAAEPKGQTPFGGDYQLGSGKVHQLLYGQSQSEVLGSVAHELTHAEQDMLMIRSIMDDNHVGKKITSAQMSAVKDKYKTMFQAEPSEEFVRSIADARQGKRLTQPEKMRAKELITSTEDWLNNPSVPGPFDKTTLTLLKDVISERGAKWTAELLIDQSDHPTIFSPTVGMQLFKKPNYTKEDVIQALGDPASPNFDENRARMTLDGRLAASEQEMKAKSDRYMHLKHEAEAYGVQDQFVKGLNEPTKLQCNVIDGKIVCRNPQ